MHRYVYSTLNNYINTNDLLLYLLLVLPFYTKTNVTDLYLFLILLMLILLYQHVNVSFTTTSVVNLHFSAKVFYTVRTLFPLSIIPVTSYSLTLHSHLLAEVFNSILSSVPRNCLWLFLYITRFLLTHFLALYSCPTNVRMRCC